MPLQSLTQILSKQNRIPSILAAISIVCYAAFSYDLVRTDYIKLVALYATLFLLFYKLVQIKGKNFKFLAGLAILFRLIFLVATPNLSQDFYRFIWDGRMILEGLNPYLYTVESFISTQQFPVSQAQELYHGMGELNAGHYTNYPPINQLCFVIAGLFAGKSILGSVVVMRILIIAADIGTLYFGKKLLERLNIPVRNIFWYILNPFIIIELTGNLHFEGVMIFFLFWSLYLLHKGKWQWAAVVFALSISVKLIPLIFLPLFWQWFVSRGSTATDSTPFNDHKDLNVISSARRNDKVGQAVEKSHNKGAINWIPASAGMTKLLMFYCIVGVVTLLLFLPFYSTAFVSNFINTVGLWFQNFEFNASLYYIAREIGYTYRGFNEIAIIGAYIPKIVVGFVLLIALFRKNKTMHQLIAAMLLVITFYFFTATTVHPWYVATLLILSVFTKYKFPLVWSFVIVLSYLAYLNMDTSVKSENLWIIGLEYVIVYGVFIWEIFVKKDPITISHKNG